MCLRPAFLPSPRSVPAAPASQCCRRSTGTTAWLWVMRPWRRQAAAWAHNTPAEVGDVACLPASLAVSLSWRHSPRCPSCLGCQVGAGWTLPASVSESPQAWAAFSPFNQALSLIIRRPLPALRLHPAPPLLPQMIWFSGCWRRWGLQMMTTRCWLACWPADAAGRCLPWGLPWLTSLHNLPSLPALQARGRCRGAFFAVRCACLSFSPF